ncbi:hypothetical protein F5Y05DRAFT_392702 [Hypoxylon sp. FL0543]|nr:hypothetical protein F5Y05DRAFT_392702 [Hypoxylon sp. FL0543]
MKWEMICPGTYRNETRSCWERALHNLGLQTSDLSQCIPSLTTVQIPRKMAVTTEVFEGVGITLLLITTSFVFMRFHISVRSFNKLDPSDYLSATALLCTTASFATSDLALRALDSQVNSLPKFHNMQITFTCVIFNTLSLWTSKASILFVYIRLFGIHRRIRYISWIAIVVSGLLFAGTLCITAVKCPMSEPGRLSEWEADCIQGTVITGVVFGFLSISVDAVIFCLPIAVIYRLQLDLSKKIALSSVFFAGIVATAASIVSLYYKWASLHAWGTEFSVPLLCNAIECSLATMAGCAPAVKAFWSSYVSKRGSDNTASTPASKTGPTRLYGVYSSSSTKRSNGPAHIEGSYMMIDHPGRREVKHDGFERVSSAY